MATENATEASNTATAAVFCTTTLCEKIYCCENTIRRFQSICCRFGRAYLIAVVGTARHFQRINIPMQCTNVYCKKDPIFCVLTIPKHETARWNGIFHNIFKIGCVIQFGSNISRSVAYSGDATDVFDRSVFGFPLLTSTDLTRKDTHTIAAYTAAGFFCDPDVTELKQDYASTVCATADTILHLITSMCSTDIEIIHSKAHTKVTDFSNVKSFKDMIQDYREDTPSVNVLESRHIKMMCNAIHSIPHFIMICAHSTTAINKITHFFTLGPCLTLIAAMLSACIQNATEQSGRLIVINDNYQCIDGTIIRRLFRNTCAVQLIEPENKILQTLESKGYNRTCVIDNSELQHISEDTFNTISFVTDTILMQTYDLSAFTDAFDEIWAAHTHIFLGQIKQHMLTHTYALFRLFYGTLKSDTPMQCVISKAIVASLSYRSPTMESIAKEFSNMIFSLTCGHVANVIVRDDGISCTVDDITTYIDKNEFRFAADIKHLFKTTFAKQRDGPRVFITSHCISSQPVTALIHMLWTLGLRFERCRTAADFKSRSGFTDNGDFVIHMHTVESTDHKGFDAFLPANTIHSINISQVYTELKASKYIHEFKGFINCEPLGGLPSAESECIECKHKLKRSEVHNGIRIPRDTVKHTAIHSLSTWAYDQIHSLICTDHKDTMPCEVAHRHEQDKRFSLRSLRT